MIKAIELLQPYYPQLISFAGTVLLALANHYLRPKVQLFWGQRAFFIQVVEVGPDNSKNVLLRSKSVTVANAGRAPAENVELILTFRPNALSIWPEREYDTHENPSGAYIIRIKNIAPREDFFVDITTINRELPNFLHLRNKDSVGRERAFASMRSYPNWVNGLAFLSMLAGVIWVSSLVIRVVW